MLTSGHISCVVWYSAKQPRENYWDIVVQSDSKNKEINNMKKITTIALMAMGLAAAGMAAEFSGFVEDTTCSTKPGMKNNAEGAKSCIKNGSPAVLVTTDGKIYKISNQDKITSFAGQNVTVTGDLKGETLTI